MVSIQSIRQAQSARIREKPRLGFAFFLFAIWMASLPFARYSIYETYSIDNLFAPALLLIAFLRPRYHYPQYSAVRMRRLLTIFAVFVFFSMTQIIATMNDQLLLSTKAWSALRTSFYFLVPLIYVRDYYGLRWAKALFFWIAIAACVSVLLGSLGIMEFESMRFEQSRLGVDWLPKTTGLFSVYGDVAIIFAFVGACLVTQKKDDLPLGLSKRFFKFLMVAVLFLGLLGAQSRNMLFSLVIAVLVAYFYKPGGKSSFASTAIIAAAVFAVTGIMLVFSSSIISGVSSVGGENAQLTAQVRLESFSQAAELWWRSPVIGLGPEWYKPYQMLIDSLHNMWLKVGLRGGILGVLAMATLLLLALKGAIEASSHPRVSKDGRTIIAVMMVILFATQFYGGLSDIFWVALGICLGFWASSWDDWPEPNAST